MRTAVFIGQNFLRGKTLHPLCPLKNLTYTTGQNCSFKDNVWIASIEYDATIQIPALQHGVCERARVAVHACAI